MKKYLLVTFLLLCLVKLSFGHDLQRDIDSIIKRTKTETGDTEVINDLNALSKVYWVNGYYDNSVNSANSALMLAQKIHFNKGIGDAYNNMGVAYMEHSNYSEALKNYFLAIKTRKEIGDKSLTAQTYINMGNLYLVEGNYPEALKSYLVAVKLGDETNNTGILSNAYISMANVYSEQGNYPEALKNYFLSLKIWKQAGETHGKTLAYINIGDVYIKLGKYAEALKSLDSAYQQGSLDVMALSNYYNSVGSVYILQKKYKEALDNYLLALKSQQQLNYKYGIADSYINLGKIYFNLHKEKEAKDYLAKALLLAKESGSKVLIRDAYSGLSYLDSSTGDINGAYRYYLLYSNIKDSITNEQSDKQISLLKIQYETERKDKQISEQNLHIQNESLKNGILETRIYYGTAISLMIIGIVTLVFYLYYLRKKREKKEYEHMLTELELTVLKAQLNPHFISNSLSTIKVFIDQQPGKASEFLGKFARLMRMVLQQSERTFISLKEEIETVELYMQIESLRIKNGFDYRFECDPNIDAESVVVPPLILQPTIENAIWHGLSTRLEKGSIIIAIKIEDDLLKFVIEDNGSGQKQEEETSNFRPPRGKSYGVSITRKRIDILSKELKKNGYYNLNFLEGRTVAEMAIPVYYL